MRSTLGYACFGRRIMEPDRVQIHKSARLFGWLCLTSHRQRGHLETAPPFTIPCVGRESRYIHCSDRELNPGPSHGSPLCYHCVTHAPPFVWEFIDRPHGPVNPT